MSLRSSSSGQDDVRREAVFADGSEWVMVSKNLFRELFVPGSNDPMMFIVFGVGMDRVNRRNHAEFDEGELLREVSINMISGEVKSPSRSTLNRAIKKLIERGILKSDSNTRCLHFNRDRVTFKHGSVSPCQRDHIRAPKKPKPAAPAQKKVEEISKKPVRLVVKKSSPVQKKHVVIRKKPVEVEPELSRREALEKLAENAAPLSCEESRSIGELVRDLRLLSRREKAVQSREEKPKKLVIRRSVKAPVKKVVRVESAPEKVSIWNERLQRKISFDDFSREEQDRSFGGLWHDRTDFERGSELHLRDLVWRRRMNEEKEKRESSVQERLNVVRQNWAEESEDVITLPFEGPEEEQGLFDVVAYQAGI